MDKAEDFSLSAVFPSASAFVNALRDDIDDAALDGGWSKVSIEEGGIEYVAYFRPVLELVMRLVLRNKRYSLWSGKSGLARPKDRRERAIDGDAFRLCENEGIHANVLHAFMLGLHLYSVGSRLSWSGGMLVRGLVERDF